MNFFTKLFARKQESPKPKQPEFKWRRSYPDREGLEDEWCVSIEKNWGAQISPFKGRYEAEIHSSDICFKVNHMYLSSVDEAKAWVERNFLKAKEVSEFGDD